MNLLFNMKFEMKQIRILSEVVLIAIAGYGQGGGVAPLAKGEKTELRNRIFKPWTSNL